MEDGEWRIEDGGRNAGDFLFFIFYFLLIIPHFARERLNTPV
jgi:hypothetical protein